MNLITVSKLIEMLQQCNPDAVVILAHNENDRHKKLSQVFEGNIGTDEKPETLIIQLDKDGNIPTDDDCNIIYNIKEELVKTEMFYPIVLLM